ncbi:MAG: carboxypeptidase-like regulatory domain-containing protein, partial [Planctomycetota bacterium]
MIAFRSAQPGGDRRDCILGTGSSWGAAKRRTDEEGRFVLRGVTAGEWQIGPMGEGGTSATGRLAATSQWFEILSGEEHKSIELEGYQGLYIRGIVSSSRPLPNETMIRTVSISSERTGWLFSRVSQDEGGLQAAFEVGPLAPGPYELTVDRNYSRLIQEIRHPHARRADDSERRVTWD